MPNAPKTPGRSIRIPDYPYLPAQKYAKADGETVSDVARRALVRYVKRKEREERLKERQSRED